MRKLALWSALLCAVALAGLLTVRPVRRLLRPRKALQFATQFIDRHVQAQSVNAPVRQYREVVRPKRLDAWQVIGPGGGGAFYYPTVSPHDPNLVVATTDMTSCFVSENGGLTWRQFSLRFTCRAFRFDPKLPNRIYALAHSAGLYRSDDRARTWSLVYPDPTRVGGVWYMDDAGDPFLQVGVSGAPTGTMLAFAIDPDDSNVLFAVVEQTLMMSTDAGAHWRELARSGSANALFVDPTSPKDRRRLFTVSGVVTGVWDGTTWHGGLRREPTGKLWINGSAFGVGNDGRPVLYTASDYLVTNGVYMGGGVLGAHDGGFNWFSLNDGLLATVSPGTYPEFTAIGTSLKHPNVVYASVYAWRFAKDNKPYFGIIKTADSGKTWEPVLKESNVSAENMRDAWLSDRFGPDWGDQPLSFGVAPNNPDLVYTGDLGRILRTTDGGKHWDAVYSQGTANGYTTTGLDNTTCYGVHFDPFDSKRMFISYTDIGMFSSEDGGASWMSATVGGVPRYWVNTTYWIEFDPQVKGRMWAVQSNMHDIPRMRMFQSRGATAGAKGGVVMSEDGGKTWRVSNRGMPEMAATHVLLDPKSPPESRVLYVTGFGKGVYKSVDGGKSWSPKNTGLPQGEPLTWRATLSGDGTLYVVVIRRSEDGRYGTPDDGMLFRSRDGAETWERVTLPEGLNGPSSITVDPRDPRRLYLSAWGRYKLYGFGAPPPNGGVYLSTDAGESWKLIFDHALRVYDVTVDPRDSNIVYATGPEAAAWRSVDRGATWRRIRGFTFKNGQRVIPSPTDPSKIYITTFGSSVWYGPAEGDPQAVEDIVSPASLRFDTPQIRSTPKK